MTVYAFPSGHNPQRGRQEDGMLLRDYFAATALPWVLSDLPVSTDFFEIAARQSYVIADAMMKARDE